MAAFIVFPKVGANVLDGAVGAWRRAEGERVEKGEPLVEIITSKATFEVEAPAGGVLRKILAPENSTAPVGYVLGILAEADEPLPDPEPTNASAMEEFRRHALQVETAADEPDPSPPRKAVRATPGARRLAREQGIDLADVQAAPDRSVLTEEDVRRHMQS